MIDELEGVWKEVVVTQSRYCSGIVLEELRKNTKNLSQENRRSGPDPNQKWYLIF
jgi:hypothetical protein